MNKTIRKGTRSVIYKVYKWCLNEFKAEQLMIGLENVYERTAALTGVSVSTVRRIVLEGVENKGVFSTPGRIRKGRPTINPDNFDICSIRQQIHIFYTEKRQIPTLTKLLSTLWNKTGFNASKEHLRKMILAIGFKYRKGEKSISALVEKPKIAAKREKYLREILSKRNLPRELKKDIIYIDECYIHPSFKIIKCWQELSITNKRYNMSKGNKYIAMYAANENGIIPNTLLLFNGPTNREGYHPDMDRYNCRKWIKEYLIPNLKQPSIVVIDNAPYHFVAANKIPSTNSSTEVINKWLLENNIPFDPTVRKPELLLLVKKHRPDPIYEIDNILGEFSHTVIRLPPFHSDLNPMELIRRQVKNKLSELIEEKGIEEAARISFNSLAVEHLREAWEHVCKTENDYYERGQNLYEEMNKMLVNFEDDSSSSSSDEDYNEDTYESTADSTCDSDCEMYSNIEYLDDEVLSKV